MKRECRSEAQAARYSEPDAIQESPWPTLIRVDAKIDNRRRLSAILKKAPSHFACPHHTQTCSHSDSLPILPTINTSLIPSHLSPPGHCRPYGIVSLPLCPLFLLCRCPTIPVDLRMRCLRMCPVNGQGQDTDTALYQTHPWQPIFHPRIHRNNLSWRGICPLFDSLYSPYLWTLFIASSIANVLLPSTESSLRKSEPNTHPLTLHTKPQSWVLPSRSCSISSGERRR